MKYPITMISNKDGAIVEFTNDHSGTYIKAGKDFDDFGDYCDVGTTHDNFISCKNTEQWSVYIEPEENQENTNKVRGNDEIITIEDQWDIVSKYIKPEERNETTTDKVRGNGGATSYYDLPIGATDLGHLIKHKKMEHGIGEAFCALYRLNDNGEYKRNLTKAKYYIEAELKWMEQNV